MDKEAPAGSRLIADTPLDLRPREKALALGMKALSDEELMAIVFGTGIRGKGVVAMCEDILKAHNGHISEIARMNARDFMKAHKGIGPAKALTLLAGIELGVRAAADAIKVEEPELSSSQQAFDYMHHHLYNLPHEEFWVLLLKQNNRPLREFKVGQGGLTMTVADPRIILREALLSNSPAIMLFHNHPSGALKASRQDISLTEKIVAAAAMLEIRVLDHIIVGTNAYFSFHDEGLL